MNQAIRSEQPGDRIGRYKLLSQIGEGGCGVVYLAEQDEPVRRRVALKIIKLGMDTKSVIARFEAERQALALMDHPNIAKVFDTGATESGRPYFVMELVRGMKITDYCDEAKLSIRARLDLFIQICHAVQHAHQKGIIHRDLKPSNVLVAVNDGVALPKVIDFGIAKATGGQRLTDKTIFTDFEQFIGTPAYMSPELAVLTDVDIDTRSDIYALGVLLYELLSGKTPFDAQQLLAIGLDEMRRTIREKEPDRPSTRLSTLADAELSTTAQRRGIEAPKLLSDLRGDLDWIAMKCLEKERTRRYETANGLAADIRRYLGHEPVMACPPGALYRFRKLVRRNRLAFSAAVVVAAALMIGFGVSTWMFLREREARKRAVTAEQEERKQRQEAESRARYASANTSGDWRKFIEEKRRLNGDGTRDVAQGFYGLGVALFREQKYAEAETALREAVAIFKRTEQNEAPWWEAVQQLYALNCLGVVLQKRQKDTEVEETYREALEYSRRIRAEDHEVTAGMLLDLGHLLDGQGRLTEALPFYRQSLVVYRKLLGDTHGRVAWVAEWTISTMLKLGKVEEAEALIRDVVRLMPRYTSLTRPVSDLVDELFSDGRTDEAQSLLNDLISKVPDSVDLLRLRAEFLSRSHRFEAASADYRRLTKLSPDDAWFWHKEAAILAYLGRTREHTELCRRFLDRFGQSKDPVALDMSAKNALVLPASGQNLDAALRAAEAIELEHAKRDSKPWFEFVKGLADYRCGQFDRALEHLNCCVASSRVERTCEAEAYAVSAMTQARLHHPDEASRTFARATEMEEEGRQELQTGNWDDEWLRVFVLLREAKATVSGAPLTLDDTASPGVASEGDQIPEAEKVLTVSSPPKERSRTTALKVRGEVLAQLSRWEEAKEQLTRALDQYPSDNDLWHLLAVLCVQTGQLQAYREHCDRALDRFKNTDDLTTATRVVKDCLIIPPPSAELSIIGKVAEESLLKATGTKDSVAPWCQLNKSLVDYRRGQYGDAIHWTEEVLKKKEEVHERDGEAYAISAMAWHCMKHPKEANLALAKGRELAETKLAKFAEVELGGNWTDWIIAEALLCEAESLIEPKVARRREPGGSIASK